MAVDLSPFLVPERCGILVFECQEGVIGAGSMIPGLAQSVHERDMVANIATLLGRGRASGAQVVYCGVNKRPDGLGNAFNTPIQARMRDMSGGLAKGFSAGPIVKELEPERGDIVILREQGISGFYGTGLDSYLRNIGVTTTIVTGVSVNVGVVGTIIEAVNHGYTVVVPADCVAGDPPAYVDQALQYSIRNLAFVTSSAAILDAWP